MAAMIQIASSLPGRLRLRAPALRDAHRLDALRAALSADDGILALDGNSAAGSLIVRYDVARTNHDVILARIEAAAGPLSTPPKAGHGHGTPRVRANRIAKRGMLLGLTASLLAAGAGRKHWHASLGGLFLASLSVHLWAHRRHLLR